MYQDIPSIVSEIIERAMRNLKDAQYYHYAEVHFDRSFVLVDEQEFQELVDFLDKERPWGDYPRDFNSIVKTPDESTYTSEEGT